MISHFCYLTITTPNNLTEKEKQKKKRIKEFTRITSASMNELNQSTFFNVEKLNNKQKKQLATWNVVKDAIKKINKFALDNTSLSVKDFFYNQKRIEDFFKERGYGINFGVQCFSLHFL